MATEEARNHFARRYIGTALAVCLLPMLSGCLTALVLTGTEEAEGLHPQIVGVLDAPPREGGWQAVVTYRQTQHESDAFGPAILVPLGEKRSATLPARMSSNGETIPPTFNFRREELNYLLNPGPHVHGAGWMRKIMRDARFSAAYGTPITLGNNAPDLALASFQVHWTRSDPATVSDDPTGNSGYIIVVPRSIQPGKGEVTGKKIVAAALTPATFACDVVLAPIEICIAAAVLSAIFHGNGGH